MSTSKSSIMWTIGELVEVLRKRRDNEYDVNIGVSGLRGDGKSTLILKMLKRFKGFKQKKHQVYTRDDVIKLLKTQEKSFCWDDEAINSGYKREFQSKAQHELIKLITMYRDNYNIYASAIPFFYSLDKDLRELIFIHIHIIQRGLAVIFMPLNDNIHQTDPWDTKNNSKKEDKWQLKKAEDPNFKFPYHKISTFAGYLKFSDITSKQREDYKKLKKEKRGNVFDGTEATKEVYEKNLLHKVYEQVVDGKMTRDGLKQVCFMEGRKYSTLTAGLNRMLNDNHVKEKLTYYLELNNKNKKEEAKKKEKTDRKQYLQDFYQKNKAKILRERKLKRKLRRKIKRELKKKEVDKKL